MADGHFHFNFISPVQGAQQRLLAQTINASEKLKEQRKALKSTVAKQQVAFQVGSTSKKQHTFFMVRSSSLEFSCDLLF